MADAGYAASARRFQDDARRVLTDVSLAYFQLAAAERRLVLVEQIGSLNADLNTAVRTQLDEGEVSALEANLSAIETARARARVLDARSDRSAASLALAVLLGVDEVREQVVGGLAPPRLGLLGEVRVHGVQRDEELLPLLGRHRVTAPGDPARPLAEPGVRLLGHPEPLREDLDGQRVSEVADQVQRIQRRSVSPASRTTRPVSWPRTAAFAASGQLVQGSMQTLPSVT